MRVGEGSLVLHFFFSNLTQKKKPYEKVSGRVFVGF